MKNLWMALGLAMVVVLGGCEVKSPTATQVAVEEEEQGEILVFTAGEPTVAKLVTTVEKAGGFRNQNHASLQKSASSPVDLIVNVGELDVNVLSAALASDTKDDYYLDKVVIRSNLPLGVVGRVFQNIQVYVHDAQSGATLGNIGESSSLRLGHSILIPAKTTVVVRIQVDVLNPSIDDIRFVNESSNGPFVLQYVEIVNAKTGERIRSRGTVQQRLYISPTPEGCGGKTTGFSPVNGMLCGG